MSILSFKVSVSLSIFFVNSSVLLDNVPVDSTLFYKVEGKNEEIHDTEGVDLGRIGDEEFYSTPNHPKFKFILNGG